METKRLKISEIKNNPDNPRIIKDDKFKKLVESIKEFPEMMQAREIVVNTEHIILGGNMRYKAAKEAGLKEVPVKIVDWSEDKQRQFVIKDNVSGGEWDWDLMANEFDIPELDSWGVDLPASITGEFSDDFSLGDSAKGSVGNMIFVLADEQQELIKLALASGKSINGDTFGNENSNGNALFWIVEQWLHRST